MIFNPKFDGMATAGDVELMLAAAFGLTMAGASHKFVGSLSVWDDNGQTNDALKRLHQMFSVQYRKLTNPGSKRGKINQSQFKFPKHGK